MGLITLRPMNTSQSENDYRTNSISNLTDINTYAMSQNDVNSSISTYFSTSGISYINLVGADLPVSKTNGDIYHYSGRNCLAYYTDGLLQGITRDISTLAEPINITNTTTETQLFNPLTGTTKTIPANAWQVGRSYRFEICGIIGTGTPAGTGTIKMYLDTTEVASGTITIANGLTQASTLFKGEFTFTCSSTGTSGKLFPFGRLKLDLNGTSNTILAVTPTGATAGLVTFNSQAQHELKITWTWGTANASNSLIVNQGHIVVFC